MRGVRQGFLMRLSAGPRRNPTPAEPVSVVGLAVSAAGLSVVGVVLFMGRSRAVGRPAAMVSLICLLAFAILFLVPVWRAQRGALQRTAALTVTAVTWILAAWTILSSLAPGPLLVGAYVMREGERIAVPAEVQGRVRLRISGGLPETAAGYLSFTISGLQQPIDGVLQRSVGRVRGLGRSGHTLMGATASIHEVVVHGESALVVERLRGLIVRPLLIQILPPSPWSSVVVFIGIHLILAAAILARGLRLRHRAWLLGAVVGGAMAVNILGDAGLNVGSALTYLAMGALAGTLAAAAVEQVARRMRGKSA